MNKVTYNVFNSRPNASNFLLSYLEKWIQGQTKIHLELQNFEHYCHPIQCWIGTHCGQFYKASTYKSKTQLIITQQKKIYV